MKSLTRKNITLIQSLYSRHGRKKSDLCVCEGIRACKDVIRNHQHLIEFAICAENFNQDDFNIDFIELPLAEIKKISSTVNSQGIILVLRKPKILNSIENIKDPFFVFLDNISDPGNFGTIIRAAKAIGLTSLCYTEGSVDPFNDKIIRSAMGAQFNLSLICYKNINEAICDFRKNNYLNFYRTTPHSGTSCFQEDALFDKSIIIFGGEANGLDDIENAKNITIPMPGDYESINLAQATTVIMFEYVRRYNYEK